jgi:hypothetical protein
MAGMAPPDVMVAPDSNQYQRRPPRGLEDFDGRVFSPNYA